MNAKKPHTDHAPFPACGPMSGMWTNINHPPAVIVNSAASPVDLLSWCLGELTALRSVMNVLTVRDEDIDPNKLFEMVGHHLEPLPDVFSYALDLLKPDAKQEGDAS